MSNLTTREGATVSETKKGAVQGIAGAGAVKAIEWGAPIVIGALGTLWAWWEGLVFPWSVVFGLGVVLVLAIVANLVTSMILKLRKPGGDDRTALQLESDADHGECNRTIEDLESEVKKLRESAPDVAASHIECEKRIERLLESEEKHATRAKTHENALKALREEYFVPLSVADNQKAEIGKYLEVLRVCTLDPKLDDLMPTIKWEIRLKNRSVHRISLDSEVGPLFFESHKLTEHKELLENKVNGLYPGMDGSITFEQRLSPPEVNLLRGLPNGKFEFDKVMLYARLSGSGFEHIPRDRVVIFQRFRATLGRCSDERSQAAEELAAEVDNLKTQLREARLKLADIKLQQES